MFIDDRFMLWDAKIARAEARAPGEVVVVVVVEDEDEEEDRGRVKITRLLCEVGDLSAVVAVVVAALSIVDVAVGDDVGGAPLSLVEAVS